MKPKLFVMFFSLTFFICSFSLLTFQYAAATPKGTIAFLSSRNSKPPNEGFETTIYLIEADGSNERKWLENPEAFFGRVDWSPDGKFVALNWVNNLGFSHIFVMNLRTGEQKNITARWEAGGASYAEAAWSKNGKWLTLTCSPPFPAEHSDICVIDAKGRKLENLTRFPGGLDYTSSWSPDASKIVFVSNRSGNTEIYVMNRNGREIVQLTNHPARDLHPDWSPDGQKIAFYSRRSGQDDIYVMNPDGTNVVNLTRHLSQDRVPAWSPDGKWIAFQSNRDKNWNIYIIDATGNNQTRVTNHPGLDSSPAWVIPGPSLAVNAQGK